jgi:hypothetical protein
LNSISAYKTKDPESLQTAFKKLKCLFSICCKYQNNKKTPKSLKNAAVSSKITAFRWRQQQLGLRFYNLKIDLKSYPPGGSLCSGMSGSLSTGMGGSLYSGILKWR